MFLLLYTIICVLYMLCLTVCHAFLARQSDKQEAKLARFTRTVLDSKKKNTGECCYLVQLYIAWAHRLFFLSCLAICFWEYSIQLMGTGVFLIAVDYAFFNIYDDSDRSLAEEDYPILPATNFLTPSR